MNRTVLVAILLFMARSAYCQHAVEWNYETWWGVMSSTRVASRISLYNDIHYSNDLFVAYRTGLTYHPIGDNFITTVAYAYLKLTTPWSDGDLIRSEHRPWMQIVYRVPSSTPFSTSFRFKYDMRFIQDMLSDELLDSYSLNHRWRINNSLRYHLNASHPSADPVSAVMLNEALFTTGPGPNGVFYEHRTHFLAELRTGIVVLSGGYMLRYLAVSSSQTRMTHGPIFWLTVNLDLWNGQDSTFLENPEDH
jgi:hypothetical protein